MAPNVHRLLDFCDAELDLTQLRVKGEDLVQPVPPTTESSNDNNAGESYWEWTAATESSDDKPTADLFSVDHIVSNLIQVQSEESSPLVSPSSDDYWAESSDQQLEDLEPVAVPQHTESSNKNYWQCSHEATVSDAYWMQENTDAAKNYWQCSHEATESDAYWMVDNTDTAKSNESSIKNYWQCSHEVTESDAYWMEARTAKNYWQWSPDAKTNKSDLYWDSSASNRTTSDNYWEEVSHATCKNDNYWNMPAIVSVC
jgi:hypothetical protein